MGEPWYASVLTWAVVAGVAGWVGIGILGWITWRSAHPKRRIVYALVSNDPPSERHGPTVAPRRRGRGKPRALADPRVLVVSVALFGRQDIGTADFDRMGQSTPQPLRLDVGLPIVRILKVKKVNDARWPEPRVDGTAVAMGPGFIGHNSGMLIQVLVDGRNPTLTCPNLPFKGVNTKLRELIDTRELYASAMMRGWP